MGRGRSSHWRIDVSIMSRRLAWLLGPGLALTLVLASPPAQGVITVLTPLRDIIAAADLVFVGKVQRLDTTKPGIVIQPTEDVKGKAPFNGGLAVNLTGDRPDQRGHILNR